MNIFYYTLKQVASWTSDNSEVVIPALQRGLVWKPRQVEVLWDSLLRGFPIGSFMLSDIVQDGEAGKYYLMDGQQRYNAISIGFNTVPNARAVLWIDLEPPKPENTTRIFWIKATTIPHPWGYKNDDDSSRLNAWEKRKSLEEFKLKGNIYNNEFSLRETWPIKAKLPIPLYCLLYAAEVSDNADLFVSKSLEIFHASDFVYKKKFELSDKARLYLRDTLFPAIKTLESYKITCNHLPKEVIEKETSSDSDNQTALEVLFTRLNTGGTPISQDDLNYSAIKAYWPSIKEINDNLAEKYMHPSKLVMLAFRLALTTENDKEFRNELSIKQIRSAVHDPQNKERIETLYADKRLENILLKVDEWLGITGESEHRVPSILRTMIARSSPEVYLLIMYFAQKDTEFPIELKADEIKALAFLLHWFGNNKKNCVQEIFTRCKQGINLQNILIGISKLMHDCQLLHIYTPDEIKGFATIGRSRNWRFQNSIPFPASHFFNRIFWYHSTESKQMLLYAERAYLNTHFQNYDPARQDMWAEENRPWDYDHIVPQAWIAGKRGEYREYDKQCLWSIGNIAAISFEANRSKNNSCDYSEYYKNEESLCFIRDIEYITPNITNNEQQSFDFARVTFDRFCRIYATIYSIINPICCQTILSGNIHKRKNIIEDIIHLLPESKAHFAADDDNDYWIEREQDWAREWIGVGVVKGDFMVCFEWDATTNNGMPQHAEIGIRKAPNSKVTSENFNLLFNDEAIELNNWWYRCDTNIKKLDVNIIVEKMKEELRFLNEKIGL